MPLVRKTNLKLRNVIYTRFALLCQTNKHINLQPPNPSRYTLIKQ